MDSVTLIVIAVAVIAIAIMAVLFYSAKKTAKKEEDEDEPIILEDEILAKMNKILGYSNGGKQ